MSIQKDKKKEVQFKDLANFYKKVNKNETIRKIACEKNALIMPWS